MVKTDFVYPTATGCNPNTVILMGTFNGWSHGIEAHKPGMGGGEFVATVECKPGTEVEFRWIVDGSWVNSPNYPSRHDGDGNYNMFKMVEAEAPNDLLPLTDPIVASTQLASRMCASKPSTTPSGSTSSMTPSATTTANAYAPSSTTATPPSANASFGYANAAPASTAAATSHTTGTTSSATTAAPSASNTSPWLLVEASFSQAAKAAEGTPSSTASLQKAAEAAPVNATPSPPPTSPKKDKYGKVKTLFKRVSAIFKGEKIEKATASK